MPEQSLRRLSNNSHVLHQSSAGRQDPTKGMATSLLQLHQSKPCHYISLQVHGYTNRTHTLQLHKTCKAFLFISVKRVKSLTREKPFTIPLIHLLQEGLKKYFLQSSAIQIPRGIRKCKGLVTNQQDIHSTFKFLFLTI